MRRTCLNMIHTLARHDPRVVFIGSDLGAGTLDAMKEALPARYFMEGIAEQNLIGVAAGLAMDGYVPFVNTISTFLTRRCLEQITIDVALHNLPIRLVGNGGGLVYAPLGPTHVAIEDIALMRTVPNMAIVAPSDAEEMIRVMWDTLNWPGPLYLRLAKGGDAVIPRDNPGFAIGRAELLAPGERVLLVSTGVTSQVALAARELLAAEQISTAVLHMATIKPLDRASLLAAADGVEIVVCLEEHVVNGGLGSAVLEALAESKPARMPVVRRLGLPDRFVENYGSQQELMDLYGLTDEAVAAIVRSELPQRAPVAPPVNTPLPATA